jgi:hypothetical protein
MEPIPIRRASMPDRVDPLVTVTGSAEVRAGWPSYHCAAAFDVGKGRNATWYPPGTSPARV